MGEFSITHWLIILIILLLFFGPTRLPSLGQSLGKALRGFKEGLNTKEPEGQANDANSRIEAAKPGNAHEHDVTHTHNETKKS